MSDEAGVDNMAFHGHHQDRPDRAAALFLPKRWTSLLHRNFQTASTLFGRTLSLEVYMLVRLRKCQRSYESEAFRKHRSRRLARSGFMFMRAHQGRKKHETEAGQCSVLVSRRLARRWQADWVAKIRRRRRDAGREGARRACWIVYSAC